MSKRLLKPSRKRNSSMRTLSKRISELETDEERKFKDGLTTDTLQSSAAGTAVPTILNVVLQNDSRSGRNGAKIDLSSIQVDFWYRPKSCLNNTDFAGINCDPLCFLIRFIAVWFPSIGVSAATTSLQTLDNILEDPRHVQSYYKRDGAVNYKVLVDRTHKVEYGYASLDSTNLQWAPLAGSDFRFKKTIPLNKQCTFISAAQPPAVSGDPVKGTLAYYVIYEGSQTFLPVSAGTFKLATRLTWTDD